MTSNGLKHDREIARRQRRAEKARRRSERRNGNAPEADPANPDPQPAPEPRPEVVAAGSSESPLSVSRDLEERRRLIAWRWALRR
jgi:hypothetical protein